MSRVTDFDDVYAESRGRLLLQLYAYSGDADAAHDALDEAFISASRHWHRLRRLESLDPWLRERAVRRLDGRPRTAGPSATSGPLSGRNRPVTPPLAKVSPENTQLLRSLKALDRTSRRLVIVRRLDDTDLPSAAREVGLTDAAAEQSLARTSSTLHAAGIDSTPAGLRALLARLEADLGGRGVPAPRTLRRAGAHRRYALTTVLGVALVAVAAGAGAISASRPLAVLPGTVQTTGPTAPTQTTPQPRLSAAYLLAAGQVSMMAGGAPWRALPDVKSPTRTSVYGSCVQAADNPPPDTSWIRDFVPGAAAAAQLRQVLQLAPSDAEAQRAFRQVVSGFAACVGHQLITYAKVGAIGDRTRLIGLRYPTTDGPVSQLVVVSRSGRAVTVLSATSLPGQATPLTASRLSLLAGVAVSVVCAGSLGRCAPPPYPVNSIVPPSDGTPGGFLSVVDLPLMPGIIAPWAGTEPVQVSKNPSATACDRTDFEAGGATSVTSRSYGIPGSTKVPTLVGLSETYGTFTDPGTAKTFVAKVARAVKSCHDRELTLSVSQTAAFSLHQASGYVWRVRQAQSKQHATIFRVALVCQGSKVAEVTFTPAGGYAIGRDDFLALARRTALRLGA